MSDAGQILWWGAVVLLPLWFGRGGMVPAKPVTQVIGAALYSAFVCFMLHFWLGFQLFESPVITWLITTFGVWLMVKVAGKLQFSQASQS